MVEEDEQTLFIFDTTDSGNMQELTSVKFAAGLFSPNDWQIALEVRPETRYLQWAEQAKKAGSLILEVQ